MGDSVEPNVSANAPYSRGAPITSIMRLPNVLCSGGQTGRADSCINLLPCPENADSYAQEISMITQGCHNVAKFSSVNEWRYADRRCAQRILDFLYLGPHSAVRDHDFLRSQGITMIISVRDSRLSQIPLISIERAAKDLSIGNAYIDVSSPADIHHKFPDFIRLVNDHLLSVYHSQTQGVLQCGQPPLDPSVLVRGKILATCETGNYLSAALVAAYIISVYGADVGQTVEFLNLKRFCIALDVPIRNALVVWGDLVRARASVAQSTARGAIAADPPASSKRSLEAFRDENGPGTEGSTTGLYRSEGRAGSAPFRDIDDGML